VDSRGFHDRPRSGTLCVMGQVYHEVRVQAPGEMFPYEAGVILLVNNPVLYGGTSPGTRVLVVVQCQPTLVTSASPICSRSCPRDGMGFGKGGLKTVCVPSDGSAALPCYGSSRQAKEGLSV